MTEEGRAIGIDLGTTYSCAAIVDQGKPRVIESRLGYKTIPSIVTFDDVGNPLVGHPAEKKMVMQPRDTIYGSKRLIGRSYHSELRQQYEKFFRYKLEPDEEGFVAARIFNRPVSLIDVSAMILSEIRTAAEESLKEKVTHAVITVPAYYSENQRACVREAGQRANLEVIRVLNEPTAAAVCYGRTIRKRERILVFDLGGGTFDITILEIADHVFTVMAVDGDTFLGGIDFDRALLNVLANKLSKQLNKPIEVNPQSWERMRDAVQTAKHQLSQEERAMIWIPQFQFAGGSMMDVVENITRAEFENATAHLMERAMMTVQRAMQTAGLGPNDINEVLLVGGQTRMPMVERNITQIFGKEPSRRVHPDEVVALGAAIIASANGAKGEAQLHDVVGLPIGLAAGDGSFMVIVAENTPVPHEVAISVPILSGSQTVVLAVFQGTRPRAAENEYLGALTLAPKMTAPEVVNCEIRFVLDEESMLTIYVSAPEIGLDGELVLATTQTPADLLTKMGKERIKITPPTLRPRSGGAAAVQQSATGARRTAKRIPVKGSARKSFWRRLGNIFERR